MGIFCSLPTDANHKINGFVGLLCIADAEVLSLVDQGRCTAHPEAYFVTVGKDGVGISLVGNAIG